MTIPAKFILSGEHFVVSGARSVVVPARCFGIRIDMTEQDEPVADGPQFGCVFNCERVPIDIAPYRATVSRAVRSAFQTIYPQDGGELLSRTRVAVSSDIPPGQGAGSSSALYTAISAATMQYCISPRIHPHYMFWFGRQLEEEMTHPVSGVDNAAVSYNMPVLYRRGHGPRFLKPAVHMRFAVASSGPRELADSPYNIMKRYRESKEREFLASHEEFDRNGMRMANLIEDFEVPGRIGKIGGIFNNQFDTFDKIGLLPASASDIREAALGAGASGVKPSGAGGGGFYIAAADNDRIEDVASAWRGMGLDSVKIFSI